MTRERSNAGNSEHNLDFLQWQAEQGTFLWKTLSSFLNFARALKRQTVKVKPKTGTLSVSQPDNAGFVESIDSMQYSHTRWNPYPEAKALNMESSTRGNGPMIVLVSSDSLTKGAGYGGFTTSLLLAAYFASKKRYGLEIWNLERNSSISSVSKYIHGAMGIQLNSISMLNLNSDRVASHPMDIYLATSWWSKKLLIDGGIDENRIVYLVQEDETIFYPISSRTLQANKQLTSAKHVICNTSLLWNHLESTGKIGSLEDREFATFEPPFAQLKRREVPRSPKNKKYLVFYARPNHPRNLYDVGIAVLEKLILELDLDNWDIIFLGTGLPDSIILGGFFPVKILQDIAYSEYVSLLEDADITFSLMLAPHPSYPPLEAAQSGSWVVTNAYQGKNSLELYNNNILVVQPTEGDLLLAITKCVAMVENEKYPEVPLQSIMKENWDNSFQGLDQFVENL